MEPSNENTLITSSLIRLHMIEQEEILKHHEKENAKAGRDVGKEWAMIDWCLNHRKQWRERFLKEKSDKSRPSQPG